MRVAFYAPLKAPDHPVPSGDRAIARLLLAALRRAGATRGWEVEVASRFRSFDGAGDAHHQARIREVGARLARRLVRIYGGRPAERRPRLWFTYHLYHKAPDWLGPAVCARLDIPYVVAEASHAGKQRDGAWSIGHEAAARAIRRAEAVLALNRDDLPGVRTLIGDSSRISLLPPFVGPLGLLSGDPLFEGGRARGARRTVSCPASEPAALLCPPSPGARADTRDSVATRHRLPAGDPWLLCVAMMRGGRKLASFELLASALARPGLARSRWHLLLAGDGPARPQVEAAFSRHLPSGRFSFTGRVEGGELARLHAASDLFVWPAVGEPMGMAMLEAQAHGLPVVAARTRGVPELVRDGETGCLVPEGDAAAFADAVRSLLDAPERRRTMGEAARVRVAREHGFDAASARLGDLVETLVRRPGGSARVSGHASGEGSDRPCGPGGNGGGPR